MAIIHVDNKEYEVNGADNLLQACLSLGLDIPYFCWHPALGSVGSCRQCAVKHYKDADDKKGRIVMSCMTPATDGMWISIEDEEAKQFRENVIEWLMTNHPHDCPVCEEGGHCHLQDMTVMAGHSKRRYRFDKRTHNNQYLGPFISHEMNRCIACYRCVRFYADYAGGTDLGVYGSHNHVYFGRVTEGCLENEFSGNLTEVCPTGVFTDKTHSERYNRKWDMQFAPSICYGCSAGCNISAGERYGEIRRIENRYHGEINRYFLCDRGRFGYGFTNLKDRPLQPLLVKNNQQTLTVDQAIDEAVTLLSNHSIIGIGSPRASLESNFALRSLVGADHFYTGIAAQELNCIKLALQLMQEGPLPTTTITDIEQHDAIFVLGEDLTQNAARLALAVRQAIVMGKAVEMASQLKDPVQPWLAAAVKNVAQRAKHPLFIASVANTKLSDIACSNIQATPDELVQLGLAVANKLDKNAPAVKGLSNHLQQQANQIAEALAQAKKPLIISGCSLGSTALLQATAHIANALKLQQKQASLSLVFPEANSVGLALIADTSLEAGLSALAENQANSVIILENDIYRRTAASTIDQALQDKKVIVLDHQMTATTAKADLILSAASFAEADGTLINQEGRAQRFFQVFEPSYYNHHIDVKESWRWLHAIHTTLQQQPIDWTQFDQVTKACADSIDALKGIKSAAMDASFRIKGLKLAREPHRYSGRTSMLANQSVHEPRVPQDKDTAFAFSMEGYAGTSKERQQISFAWSPGWNSPQAWNKFQEEVGGHLKAGDPGVRLISHKGELLPWSTINQQTSTGFVIAPLYHLFGSEETTAKAAPIQERIVEPYIALHADDAKQLQLTTNDTVELKLPNHTVHLTVRTDMTMAKGVIGLPAGFAQIPVQLFGKHVTNLQDLQEVI